VEAVGAGDAICQGERTLIMYVTYIGYKPVAYHLGAGWMATSAVGEVVKIAYTDDKFRAYNGSTGVYTFVGSKVNLEFTKSF
jgi:hypothetical protein